MNTILRGRILMPHQRGFQPLEDGLIYIEHGVIRSVEQASSESEHPFTHAGCVLMPAFTDFTSLSSDHICGSASGPLLTWLNTSTFPEEANLQTRLCSQSCADLLQECAESWGQRSSSV